MKILSFGEILWDIFQNGEKRIGGAPFNFAAHAARLGAESYLISAVGADQNGEAAVAKAKRLGIKTDYISVSRRYPTGVCKVTLENGIPSYDLVRDTAYDHIPDTVVSSRFDAVYMGTLAMRSPQSRRCFEKLLEYTDKKEVLFDVNFRADFYSRELVHSLMKQTTVLKISDEEIGFFGNRGPIGTCLDISQKYPKLKFICVTMGADGAMVYDCRKRTLLYSDKPTGNAVSTVGAGDSFAACFITSLLNGYKTSECLDRAVKLSDFVVTQLGAVPDYNAFEIFAR